MRRVVVLALVAACVPAREDGARRPAARDRRPQRAASEPTPAAPGESEAAPPVADEGREDVAVRFDLVAHVGAAEIRRGALSIDIGSPSAAKHTLGGWRTGWGRDREDGGVTYAIPLERGRVYFGLDAPAVGEVRVRGKGGTLRLTLNDEPLGSMDLSGADFREAVVPFPERAVRAGENLLAVRGDSVRVDRIEIGSVAAGASVPSATELVTTARLGAAEVPTLKVPAGTTLSYSMEVPREASLRLALGATETGAGATVRVRVAHDGQAADEVLEAPVTTGAPVPRIVELGGLAGEVVRLDLAVEGPGTSEALLVAPRVVAPVARPATSRRQAKNVVVVLVDTLRADKLRPYNPRSRVVADSFERLVREGTIFEEAAPQENWTKPSVATLLTGLYPSSHNTKGDSSVLPAQALMLSEMLRDADFETAAFIANGYVSDRFGFDQGWQSYRNYVRQEIANKAEFIARDVLGWLDRRNPDRRFFLYVHAIDPHVPYSPPLEYIRRYDSSSYSGRVRASQTALLLEDIKTGRFEPGPRDRERLEALYDGEVTYNDERMNAIYEGLASRGLLEDTLLVFTSDHGEEFFDHGSVGHGHSLYRELLHVPLVMRLPGSVPAGLRVSQDVGLVDVVPTVLDLAGVATPPAVQGRSLAPLLAGSPPDAPAGVLSEFLDTQRAVTSGRYKLVLKGLTPFLYDLVADPGETRNLAADRPIALRHMRALLGRLVAGADVPMGLARRPRQALPRQTTTIDPETEEQLRALGYVGTSRPR
ncbi:MAG: sulfatase [Deltaproteobacteria bacterium]|nr:sulfatase [Deltaproteobacteria bacterium]